MKVLVTGAAGFIGSHLCERLLGEGYDVVGIDSFLDYYPRRVKESNLSQSLRHPRFRFIEGDLLRLDLKGALGGVEAVFHQAAIPGVRHSWGDSFREYADNNILATQVLLESCLDMGIRRFIYASSSSVYGNAVELPVGEGSPTTPVSPYGVSKLAGEKLALLYWKNYGIPVICLRYFTVYGPRQRPDMAFHRFLLNIHLGREITIYGDGEQTRDFTFVDDALQANLSTLERGRPGRAYNIGGGNGLRLKGAISVIEEVTGRKANLVYREKQKGDARDTFADVSSAGRGPGYSPHVGIEEGVRRHYEWLREHVYLYA